MKTSVDIPEDELKDAMKYARAKTKREAIVAALVEYNKRKRMAELVEYSAVSETLMSNEEIEDLDRQARLPGASTARRRGSRA